MTACLPIQIAVSTANLAVGTFTEYLTIGDPCAIDGPTDRDGYGSGERRAFQC